MANDELVADLRKAAHDIATEGHNGWGNLCAQAADAIERRDAYAAKCDAQAEVREERLQERAEKAEADLMTWRSWAQFVWLGGGKPECSDDELRTRVCEAADKDASSEVS